MSKIKSVRTSVKEDKVLAVISIEGRETPIFLTSKQISAATGISKNFSVLKGSDIEVSFYKIDDELSNGQKCTKDDTIIKEYSIELHQDLAKIAMAASLGASMF